MSDALSAGRRLGRYWHTLRHLERSQVLWRLRRQVIRPAPRIVDDATLRPLSRTWQRCLAKPAGWTDAEHWSCHGQTWHLPAGRAWIAKGMPRLQQYQLHYVDDLSSATALADPMSFAWLVERWLGDNPRAAGAAWEPYVLSRRIVNFCKWRHAGGQWGAGLTRSVATQAELLTRTVEHDVLGNHIIANAAALVFAGEALAGSLGKRCLELGTSLLRTQLARQVLGDGGHYERSPMYQAVVVEDLLDVLNVFGGAEPGLSASLRGHARHMLSWLVSMTMPDGDIALFNDAAFDGCRSTAAVLGYAARLGIDEMSPGGGEGLTVLRESGYVRAQFAPWTLVADVGDVGPGEQAGHAHADTLSFELAVGSSRLFVDPGTSTYEAGPLRGQQRGTEAHNTLCVDGADSSEVWGAFRTARRARARLQEATAVGGEVTIRADHDGYARFPEPVSHTRTWRVSPRRIAIDDELSGVGAHDVAAGFLLEPRVSARVAGPHEFELLCDGLKLRMLLDPALDWHLEDAQWYPRFGQSHATKRIAGTARVLVPARLACSVELALAV